MPRPPGRVNRPRPRAFAKIFRDEGEWGAFGTLVGGRFAAAKIIGCYATLDRVKGHRGFEAPASDHFKENLPSRNPRLSGLEYTMRAPR